MNSPPATYGSYAYRMNFAANTGATGYGTWTTCPSCGAHYQGYHQCWTVPAQPAQRLTDDDVERIARRVAELLTEKE